MSDTSWQSRALGLGKLPVDATLQEIVEASARVSFLARCGLFIGLTMLVTEYIQTLEGEWSMFWTARLSIGKMLFLISRYLVFAEIAVGFHEHWMGEHMPKDCQLHAIVIYALGVIGIAACEGAVVTTLVMLLPSNAGPRATFLTLGVAQNATVLALAGMYLGQTKFVPPPHPDADFICSTEVPENAFLYRRLSFYILMSGQLTMLASIIVFGLMNFRRSKSTLCVTLYKYGSMYYTALLALTVLDGVAIFNYSPQEQRIFGMIQRVIHPILANRLLLKMRMDGAYSNMSSECSSTPSSIHFTVLPTPNLTLANASKASFNQPDMELGAKLQSYPASRTNVFNDLL